MIYDSHVHAICSWPWHPREPTYKLIASKNINSELMYYRWRPGDHPEQVFRLPGPWRFTPELLGEAGVGSGPNLEVHVFRAGVVVGKAVRVRLIWPSHWGCVCCLVVSARPRDLRSWSVRLWLYHLPRLVDESLGVTRTCLSALIDFEGHELGSIRRKQPIDTTHMLRERQ